jgi:hypothetical protein
MFGSSIEKWRMFIHLLSGQEPTEIFTWLPSRWRWGLDGAPDEFDAWVMRSEFGAVQGDPCPKMLIE